MDAFNGDGVLHALDSAVWLAVDAVAAVPPPSPLTSLDVEVLHTLERALSAVGPAAAPLVARLFRLHWLCVAEKAAGDPTFLASLSTAYGAAVGGEGGKAAAIPQPQE